MSHLQSLFGLDGKAALVSGASRGIGAAVAVGLARAGASVTGVGRSQACVASEVRYRSCDVADGERFERISVEIADTSGGLDIYVHAAAITTPESNQRPETFTATIEANLTTAYRCCRTAAARMRTGGSIVVITSIGGMLAFPDNPAYAASKGGLRSMARALALDYAPRGIRVNTVAPGYVRTAMTESSYQDPERRAARQDRTMLGRWGDVEDMVGGVIYLVSPAAAYVTGHELVIDGGWSARGL